MCVFAAQADVVAVQYSARTKNTDAPTVLPHAKIILFQPFHAYEIIGDIEVRGITSPAGDFTEQMRALDAMNVDALTLYERAEDAEGSELVEQVLCEEATKHGAQFVIVIQKAVAKISGNVVMHYVRAKAIRNMEQAAAP